MAHQGSDGSDATRSTVPGDSTDFFRAPIDALIRSLNGKSSEVQAKHDPMRAYTLFVDHIKAFATSVDATATLGSPALEYLGTRASAVATCISRDIGLAFVEPASVRVSRGATGVLHVSRRLDEVAKEATRLSMICQNAMRLASCIFAFPVLCAVLPEGELSSIVQQVLDILAAEQLPTLNAQKIRGLAIWILSTQQLSATVLSTRAEKIIEVIKATVNDANGSEHTVGDSLKTLHNLLHRHPSLFLLHSVGLFAAILHHLTSSHHALRLRAAYTLAGFTHAALWSRSAAAPTHQADSLTSARDHLRQSVCKFSEAQCEYSRGGPTALRDLITAAVPAKDDAPCGQDVSWAFSVMACLTVLADSSFYACPPLLRMVVRALQHTPRHAFAPLRRLHSFAWRCLVWAFGRLADAPALPPSQDPARSPEADFRERVFATVRQDGRHGVRSALVAVLLDEARRQPGGDAVAKAILVVEELLERSSWTLVAEGIALLRQLTSAVGPSPKSQTAAPFDLQQVLVISLLDGCLVDVEPCRLAEAVSRMEDFEPAAVRPLTEAEVDSHWDRLLAVWQRVIERVLKENMLSDLRSDLLETWKALLYAKAKRPQAAEHGPEALNSVIPVVKDFVARVASEKHTAALRLTVFRALWRAMRSVFGQARLCHAADELLWTLAPCFDSKVKLDGEERTVLDDAATDVLLHSSPDFLAMPSTLLGSADPRLRLWQLTADRWAHVDPSRPWRDTTTFLSAPIRLGLAPEVSKARWKDLLRYAVSCAQASFISSDRVIEDLSRKISPNPIPSDLIPVFITHLTLNDDGNVATTILQHINAFLSSYPPQDIYPSLEVIDTLSNIISNCMSSNVLPALQILLESLCTWIGADEETVSDADYESVVVKFYCTTLQRLRDVPSPISSVLRDMEDLLCLPLMNIRSTTGPLALKDFCEAAWRDREGIIFPEKLLLYLGVWYDVTVPRALRPAFLPEPSQTQTQFQWQSQLANPKEGGEVDTLHSGEMPLPLASARPAEAPNEQRKSSSGTVLLDSSKVNEARDTCSAAVGKRDSQEPLLAPDHSPSVSRACRSPENLDPTEPLIVLGKRDAVHEGDDRTKSKKLRRMDSAIPQDQSGKNHQDEAQQSHATDENYLAIPTPPGQLKRSTFEAIPTRQLMHGTGPRSSYRSMSPEVPHPADTSLPSPPDTVRIEQWEAPTHDSSPVPEEVREFVEPSRAWIGMSKSSQGNAQPIASVGSSRTSHSLRALQQACEALMADPELSVHDALSAQRIAAEMQAALAGHLKERLAGKEE